MANQLTRNRIFNTLLIGTLVLGIGSINIQPAPAQISRSDFFQTARELDFSRSQMRKVAGILRGYKSDITDILTPRQFDLLQSARKQQRRSQPQAQVLREALDLTDTQAVRLAAAREDMVTDLQEVLTPRQLAGIVEKISFSRF